MTFSPWAGADLTREQYEALTAPGNVSNVVYDNSTPKRVLSLTIDGVDYTIDYTSTLITISGSDGSVKRASLDANGNYTQVVTEIA